jgi:NAD(P)-dependent dehydrogenase (short-subunit alcohol dehydrogenase family)
MAPLGVTVNIIEPGSFKTPVWRKMADLSLAQAGQSDGEVPAKVQQIAKRIVRIGAGQAEPDVATRACLALSSVLCQEAECSEFDTHRFVTVVRSRSQA